MFAPEVPLYVVLFAGGIPLVFSLAVKLVRGQFRSDLSPESRLWRRRSWASTSPVLLSC